MSKRAKVEKLHGPVPYDEAGIFIVGSVNPVLLQTLNRLEEIGVRRDHSWGVAMEMSANGFIYVRQRHPRNKRKYRIAWYRGDEKWAALVNKLDQPW